MHVQYSGRLYHREKKIRLKFQVCDTSVDLALPAQFWDMVWRYRSAITVGLFRAHGDNYLPRPLLVKVEVETALCGLIQRHTPS